uniref:Solute carrier family 40 member n=1 Tax=Panagrolaimus sp. JU765 TaxID=591449 RepID=A0AC34R9G1_9BILA
MKLPTKPFRFLYFGYIVSCIGDRLWTFAIIFVLQHLGGMRLVGINQLVESVSAMVFASFVGNWLDKNDRKKGTLTVLAFNNISVAISAGLLAICLTISKSSYFYAASLTLSIFFCALSKCASDGEKMAFTKDWIVVMAKTDPANSLSSQNAIMTTIDQLSSVIAPILTGFILEKFGHRSACFVFVVWNLLSWIIERILLSNVYKQVGELAVRENKTKVESESREEKHGGDCCGLFSTYFRQTVFPAAFGLSLLYMTVLGFDGLAISFGKSQGVSEIVLGVFRSLGSVLGILGAVSYAYAEQHFGIKKTGFFGLIFQQVFLWFCVLSVFLPGSPFDPIGYIREWTLANWFEQFKSAVYMSATDDAGSNMTFSGLEIPETSFSWSSMFSVGMSSVMIFFCGITFARFGLWMADLSITQIMQENVAEQERNTVFGVQNALCQFFSVLKDIVVILLPDERTFGFLIIMSVVFVTLGFLNYCYYVSKPQKTKTITLDSQNYELEPFKLEL